jgi:aryl-alcohol dehydrogenase-like predicted oxidoreductase
LGRSGLHVSRACLGTMTFGNTEWGTDEAESLRIVDTFLDAGHNFIDTADVYNAGVSEEIVGRAVARRRGDVVLATKGYNAMGPGRNDRGSSRAHLTRALEASLRRLGTDHIDLYQLHNWDHDTPIEESMATLDSFVRSGKVRYIGCSNFFASQLVEAQWAAERINGTTLVSLQPQYSLIWRDIELDILPTATRHGMGVIVWSPLGGGMLTGKYTKGGDRPADGRLSRGTDLEAEGMRMLTLTDQNFEIVAEVEHDADGGEPGLATRPTWRHLPHHRPPHRRTADPESRRVRADPTGRAGQGSEPRLSTTGVVPLVHAAAPLTPAGHSDRSWPADRAVTRGRPPASGIGACCPP